MTTNGSQLARFADDLAACGIRRINVSIDTLDPDRFKAITRWGDFDKVMEGIAAASAAGIKIKINAVALAGVNEDEYDRLIEWCHARGHDLTLIETMPVRERLERRWTLTDTRTGPAARRVTVRSARPADASASSRR